MKVGLLYASEVSISLAFETSEEKHVISNDELLSFCKEGPLRELFERDYESQKQFKKALSLSKAITSAILTESSLPSFIWRLQENRAVLEVQSTPPETAVFVVRICETS